MPKIQLTVETPISNSSRVKQLSAMFDVPAQKKASLSWEGDIDLEAKPWQIGLIVGPSGAGKTSLLHHIFGAPQTFAWTAPSVVDDFDKTHTMDAIASVCQAVGFNTIPAWMRPFAVLSNGERFRVELARRLLDSQSPIIVDEFTSVVDRQVAKIGAHAVQKYVRKQPGRQFVAASCHYDIIDWLQPDWTLDPTTMVVNWRSLQRRPPIECVVERVPFAVWRRFAPFHYLTKELHRSARCFALSTGGQMAAFAGMLYRPHPKVRDIMGCSRLVTLPDFQGLGLAMALIDVLGAAYRAIGQRVHTYPAHPALVRTFDRSAVWALHKRPGRFDSKGRGLERFGGRPCAVFEYAGLPMSDSRAARALVNPDAS